MVGYQGDFSDEYLYWDNVEAVTVTIIVANTSAAGVDPTTTDISIARAFRGDVHNVDKPLTDVEIGTDSQEWSIPAALMGANELRKAYTITDSDSVRWQVDSAVMVRIGTSKLNWLAQTHKVQFDDESL